MYHLMSGYMSVFDTRCTQFRSIIIYQVCLDILPVICLFDDGSQIVLILHMCGMR